jgi:hypothetical protein
VDLFVHLLVNYVYRFYCINDRVDEYHQRLNELVDSHELGEDGTVAYLRRCAHNILQPSPSFLADLHEERSERPAWLHGLATASAFVAEIADFAGEDVDLPGVFLSRQFDLPDTDRFAHLLARAARACGVKIRLVHGRKVNRDIRWSLLALVWFADAQLLFLPRNWKRRDGTEKDLSGRENWVMLELLYGRLLRHPLTTAIAHPPVPAVVERFRDVIRNYTEEKEIEQVPKAGWEKFVRDAKESLADDLHHIKHVPVDLDQFDTAFVPRFAQDVATPAARRFVDSLFESWWAFFDAPTWASMQAVLAMCTGVGSGYKDHPYDALRADTNVKAVARKLYELCRLPEPPCEWAAGLSPRQVVPRVREHLKALAEFRFRLDGALHSPLEIHDGDNQLRVTFRLGSFYEHCCRRLGIEPDAAQLREIVRRLSSHRTT